MSYRGYLLIVFAAFTFSLGVFFALDAHKNNTNNRVFSHRGASGEKIEHTFAAYDLALQQGSKYIEQDLVTSKDDTLYVSHDASAKRITGIDALYTDMTDREINALRTKNSEHIHTLQDVFNRYGKKVTYVIELKENTTQVDLFRNIIKKNHMERNVIVQASSVEPLNSLENDFPHMPKLLLITKQIALEKAITYKNVDIIGAHKSLMNTDNIALTHKNGKQFNTWTLNSREEITRAILLGVDNYFTNYTSRALNLENKYR